MFSSTEELKESTSDMSSSIPELTSDVMSPSLSSSEKESSTVAFLFLKGLVMVDDADDYWFFAINLTISLAAS